MLHPGKMGTALDTNRSPASAHVQGWAAILSFALVVVTACAGVQPPIRADGSVFDYDSDLPLELAEDRRISGTSTAVRHVTYPSPRGGDVSAMIFQPVQEPPRAGVILQHGMPGRKSDMARTARTFACANATAITIDAPFARWETRFREPLTCTLQDRDEQIQLIVDLRRTVDVLLTEIESGPIGYLGVSYGAAMGGLLAGIEHRIAAFALVVGDGGLVAHFTDDEGRPLGPLSELSEDQALEWLTAMGPVEPALFIGDASAPILLLNGREDQLVTEADANAYHQAAGPNHEVIWYDAGHGLNEEAWYEQVRWMGDRLQLDADRVEACLETGG